MFEGFENKRMAGEGAEINLRVGGPTGADVPAVLLIHGYPQSHIIWRHLAPRLAKTHRVVCPDLRGYGDSSCPPTDDSHEPYSKRAMARDLVRVMTDLGHQTFTVVGHDRGARVGHRLSMDSPDRVTRFCSLDVVPTGSVWQRANKNWAMGSFHWLFLAQPYPRPETMINHDPDYFLTWLLESWSADMAAFADGALEEYKRHYRKPAVVHANCEDYRAGATIDDALDRADLEAGRKLHCPVLALWGGARKQGGPKTDGATPALDIWREWADEVTGGPLPCGHFLAEEAPDAVWERLAPFLGIAE
tara:strand:- start:112 stop:1023 length:912 start_codon:yes stop_codon:yes gene_type:complete